MKLIPYRLTNPVLPFEGLGTLHNSLNRVFDEALTGFGEAAREDGGLAPVMDVHEDADAFTVKVELPGIEKDAVKLTFQDGRLVLEGEKNAEVTKEDEHLALRERTYGKFYRSLEFPTPVDAGKVCADYKAGVLTVTVPKAEDAKPKEIDINVN